MGGGAKGIVVAGEMQGAMNRQIEGGNQER